jgi:2',3'-cyclic-nucleotide 2'-phosphodiesterase (5'-nucleotidase family)
MLMVDAGDLLFKKYSGPVPENELKMAAQKAHVIIETLNLMGYDAFGIGDDDLTLGKEFLVEAAKKAKFPFLSSNLVDDASGKPLFQPYLIKGINGIKVGIFSLLSSDFIPASTDPRRMGLAIRPPVETATQMIKELQPRADLILLLSHLGYIPDVELARKISGIQIILGSHSPPMNLVNPQIIKDTILLQTASKGMYAGKIEITFAQKEAGFYNVSTKRSLETSLANLKNRLNSPGLAEAEKTRILKSREQTEKSLGDLQGKNPFTNAILPLNDLIKDHPDIQKLVDEYKSKYPEPIKPVPPK